MILQDVIDEAQAVRVHRNNLVHRRIDDYYAMMTFADARAKVLTYLDELPGRSGADRAVSWRQREQIRPTVFSSVWKGEFGVLRLGR